MARVRAGQRGWRTFADTEEVTGSIPVSPTSKTAGQPAGYRVTVTSHRVVAPYIGSKMGAQDRPASLGRDPLTRAGWCRVAVSWLGGAYAMNGAWGGAVRYLSWSK